MKVPRQATLFPLRNVRVIKLTYPGMLQGVQSSLYEEFQRFQSAIGVLFLLCSKQKQQLITQKEWPIVIYFWLASLVKLNYIA